MSREQYNFRSKVIADTRIRCDRCGEPIPGRRREGRDETTIERSTGTAWPDSGDLTYHFTDCCPACWPEAQAALEAAGFVFNTRQVEW